MKLWAAERHIASIIFKAELLRKGLYQASYLMKAIGLFSLSINYLHSLEKEIAFSKDISGQLFFFFFFPLKKKIALFENRGIIGNKILAY